MMVDAFLFTASICTNPKQKSACVCQKGSLIIKPMDAFNILPTLQVLCAEEGTCKQPSGYPMVRLGPEPGCWAQYFFFYLSFF